MTDFFEIDFLDVESDKSGDAIPLRYGLNGLTHIHVVDGGFTATGQSVIDHINKYYDAPTFIDNVVVTHPDGDHAAGLKAVLEHFDVGALWMLRPWKFAGEIIHRFDTYESVPALQRELKTVYCHLADLEEIAERRGIPILDPFQSAMIGAFTVMAPTKARYLDLIVESQRTPEAVAEDRQGVLAALGEGVMTLAKTAVAVVRAAWGDEYFSPRPTSRENEMSVVQYASLCGEKIMLTGDAGREALQEVVEFAPAAGLILPGINRFQVPHHGSRRNVSSEILDDLLGPKLGYEFPAGSGTFTAIVSSAKADEHHPRKSVLRAMMHRGANVYCTEGKSVSTYKNKSKPGWGAITPTPYPSEQEE